MRRAGRGSIRSRCEGSASPTADSPRCGLGRSGLRNHCSLGRSPTLGRRGRRRSRVRRQGELPKVFGIGRGATHVSVPRSVSEVRNHVEPHTLTRPGLESRLRGVRPRSRHDRLSSGCVAGLAGRRDPRTFAGHLTGNGHDSGRRAGGGLVYGRRLLNRGRRGGRDRPGLGSGGLGLISASADQQDQTETESSSHRLRLSRLPAGRDDARPADPVNLIGSRPRAGPGRAAAHAGPPVRWPYQSRNWSGR